MDKNRFFYVGIGFERLKEILGKKMSRLLKLTDCSQAQAYFLINLVELTEKYNKLAFSDFPTRFFKTTLKIFRTI